MRLRPKKNCHTVTAELKHCLQTIPCPCPGDLYRFACHNLGIFTYCRAVSRSVVPGVPSTFGEVDVASFVRLIVTVVSRKKECSVASGFILQQAKLDLNPALNPQRINSELPQIHHFHVSLMSNERFRQAQRDTLVGHQESQYLLVKLGCRERQVEPQIA